MASAPAACDSSLGTPARAAARGTGAQCLHRVPERALSQAPEPRWLLPPPLAPDGLAAGDPAVRELGLPVELLAVLQRRGHGDVAAIRRLLDPDAAPDPQAHFPDLEKAAARLAQACGGSEKVAICGDYDADGMTSTALLVGVLRELGAVPRAAIPQRHEEGYGLNPAMVERLAAEGVRLLITVDNGVAAEEALVRAAALGLEVILTDHHTLPPRMPPHLALLHPAVTPPDSPYRGLAGVGLAHVLATCLCLRLGRREVARNALDLFCIGTIADMAPLQGVNRRWLLDGLSRLGQSRLAGLRCLQQLAGIENGEVDAAAVGFRLAPRINAVGRLGDPLMVVDLLTTADDAEALELARRCEALNRQRRELCDAIEAEALALLEADGSHRPPFLLIAQSHWHHGVIGIVAARLVERFGQPVALLAGEGTGHLRASVRAPRGFAVDQALAATAHLLERHGGHPAAGGFTVRPEAVADLHEELNRLASAWLGPAGGGPLVEPEALLQLERIEPDFWRQLRRLEPFGPGHPAPVFWSRDCLVEEQRILRGGHLQLVLRQGDCRRRAVGWRWPDGERKLTGPVDVAYRLRCDRWQGQDRLQLELLAVRTGSGAEVVLRRSQRSYRCRRLGGAVVIRNESGEEVSAPLGPETGETAPLHPYVQSLLREAAVALGLSP